MEIERKFLLKSLPDNHDKYPFHQIEQGYLCTDPVVRIRRQDEDYYLTYKSKGLMVREEYNLPLTKKAYEHLIPKIDSILISKKRYLIPIDTSLTIELDIFEGELAPLILARRSIAIFKSFYPFFVFWQVKNVYNAFSTATILFRKSRIVLSVISSFNNSKAYSE